MLSRRTRVVLAVLVACSLTLVILDLRGGDGPLNSVKSFISNIFGGLESGAAAVFSPITGATEWWSTLHSQSSQIRALNAENDQLRTDLRALENDKARADALDALLGVASVGQYRFIPAEVIAVGPAQDFAWAVTIDAGERDGIEQDMTVINGQGLVGRVAKTTSDTATVVLVVDVTSAVGGRVAGTEEIGIVSGTGQQDLMDFEMLDPLADVRVGDALVTFGSKGGRPYAPGLPIGEVVEVKGTAGQLTRVAKIRPYVDFSTLSIVGVVTKPPREDPRDSVLPKVTKLPTTAPAPVPLAPPADAGETAKPSDKPSDGPSGKATDAPVEEAATRAPSAAPERETVATPAPSESP